MRHLTASLLAFALFVATAGARPQPAPGTVSCPPGTEAECYPNVQEEIAVSNYWNFLFHEDCDPLNDWLTWMDKETAQVVYEHGVKYCETQE